MRNRIYVSWYFIGRQDIPCLEYTRLIQSLRELGGYEIVLDYDHPTWWGSVPTERRRAEVRLQAIRDADLVLVVPDSRNYHDAAIGCALGKEVMILDASGDTPSGDPWITHLPNVTTHSLFLKDPFTLEREVRRFLDHLAKVRDRLPQVRDERASPSEA